MGYVWGSEYPDCWSKKNSSSSVLRRECEGWNDIIVRSRRLLSCGGSRGKRIDRGEGELDYNILVQIKHH